MRNISTMMNRKYPAPQAVTTDTLCLFILAFVIAAAAPRPATADTLCINSRKAFHDVTFLSETKDSVRVQLRDGHVINVPRKMISLVLNTGMKVYVYRNDWSGFTAFFRGSDESGYTFASRPDGTGVFTVKENDIFFMTDMIPAEAGKDATANQPAWFEQDAWSLLFAAGFLQGIFLAFMLIRRKTGNLRANRSLALFIIIVSVALSGGFIETYLFKYPYVHVVSVALRASTLFLIGPLLFYYVLVITRSGFRPRLRHCLHLMPAFLVFVYFLCHAVMMNRDDLIVLSYPSIFFVSFISERLLPTISSIHPLIYVILSMHFLAVHRRRIKGLFSSTEKLNLSWLTFILRFMLGGGVLLMVSLLVDIVIRLSIWDYRVIILSYISMLSYNTAGLLMVLLFFAIGYRGLAQPEIFAGIPEDLVKEPDGPEQKVSIPPEKIHEIMDKIIKVMEEDRPYLDSGLTLPMLADMAGVSRNLLSQAINEHTKQNFYDFVNFYRIETVKEHLQDASKREINVLHIAFDAGFNSKATFNAVFKKNTGLTPTQYRKSIMDN